MYLHRITNVQKWARYGATVYFSSFWWRHELNLFDRTNPTNWTKLEHPFEQRITKKLCVAIISKSIAMNWPKFRYLLLRLFFAFSLLLLILSSRASLTDSRFRFFYFLRVRNIFIPPSTDCLHSKFDSPAFLLVFACIVFYVTASWFQSKKLYVCLYSRSIVVVSGRCQIQGESVQRWVSACRFARIKTRCICARPCYWLWPPFLVTLFFVVCFTFFLLLISLRSLLLTFSCRRYTRFGESVAFEFSDRWTLFHFTCGNMIRPWIVLRFNVRKNPSKLSILLTARNVATERRQILHKISAHWMRKVFNLKWND